ncbi:hypothetical protein KAFR_0B03150 [Kazachstania africana CBS 2517]|uniref:Protoheme IX farnesyltransferase, mitochondrial n=1 Tax=Kazachstania africana (strain ATCC 22294 / BCRC 22015 / CBS 2517 / CECT 1963 / NBRC 1671 / NRRL Y-8276) TaxID=1071382 RepID=H2AQG1_KAZAF|nr:hypothetical protein KAFR_0B03150 [Kazachstania africana CBS 2517]CCF56611.1 hypothetical protein KAFR_0B03150 [Kazachstania africana CBS 2517]
MQHTILFNQPSNIIRRIPFRYDYSFSRYFSINKCNLTTARYLATTTINRSEIHVNTAPIEFTSNICFTRRELKRKHLLDEKSQVKVKYPFKVKELDETELILRKMAHSHVEPPPANSILSKTTWTPYIQLTKPRLTILVMLSAICSYALSPNAASMLQLLSLTAGTTLCSGAANAINMGREPEFDRQMTRTQKRPVVTGAVTPLQAYEFAAAIGTLGVYSLYFGVNPTVATLGALNIVLYSWIYTSLKRKHIINTWVGGLVGAIPPLMGWAAASSLADPGAWCLAALLYAWQFPHFNTLSHNIRNEYKNAGYVMTAWKNPKLNARVTLRYSLLMFPLCIGLSYFNVTDWFYVVDSSIANAWLTFWAFKFYWQQHKNYSKNVHTDKVKFNNGLQLSRIFARKTTMASIVHLPAVLLLAIFHKKDRWKWLFEDGKFS